MPHAMSTNTRVYVDAYDISGDSSSAEVSATAVMCDDSAFGVSGRTHQKGILDDTVTYEGFFDDAWSGTAEVGGVDSIFSQLRTSTSQAKILSIYPNLDTLGQPGWSGLLDMSTYSNPIKVAELVTVKASFGIEGGVQAVKSLGAKATKTATTHGTGIDDVVVSSANGGVWYYHIFAISATGGNTQIQIVLEDSADNVNFTTVGTESYNVTNAGGAIAAGHTFTGTLREYVRVSAVKDCTTLSVTYQANYHRGQNGPTN